MLADRGEHARIDESTHALLDRTLFRGKVPGDVEEVGHRPLLSAIFARASGANSPAATDRRHEAEPEQAGAQRRRRVLLLADHDAAAAGVVSRRRNTLRRLRLGGMRDR